MDFHFEINMEDVERRLRKAMNFASLYGSSDIGREWENSLRKKLKDTVGFDAECEMIRNHDAVRVTRKPRLTAKDFVFLREMKVCL